MDFRASTVFSINVSRLIRATGAESAERGARPRLGARPLSFQQIRSTIKETRRHPRELVCPPGLRHRTGLRDPRRRRRGGRRYGTTNTLLYLFTSPRPPPVRCHGRELHVRGFWTRPIAAGRPSVGQLDLVTYSSERRAHEPVWTNTLRSPSRATARGATACRSRFRPPGLRYRPRHLKLPQHAAIRRIDNKHVATCRVGTLKPVMHTVTIDTLAGFASSAGTTARAMATRPPVPTARPRASKDVTVVEALERVPLPRGYYGSTDKRSLSTPARPDAVPSLICRPPTIGDLYRFTTFRREATRRALRITSATCFPSYDMTL